MTKGHLEKGVPFYFSRCIPAYKTMPNAIHTGSGADFSDMPSPDMIEGWANDQTKGPVVNKEPVSQDTVEPTEEPQKEVEQAQPQETETEQKTQQPETKAEKKTRYQLAKEQSEKQAKEDEHRRNEAWKAVRLAQDKVEKERQEIEKAKKGLDYTPEQWLALAQDFENSGQYDKAELARKKAAEVEQYHKQTQQFQQSEEEKRKQWELAERDIANQDPLFFQEGSYVREGLQKIFSDPEQASLYYSHPLGIWAAYWNVQTQHAQKIIPPLVKYAQELEVEVKKLRAATEPLGSSPRGASLDEAKKFSDMSDAHQAALLQKQFESMG